MELSSTDKTVRNDIIEDLKEFHLQSLTTQAKKRRATSFNDASS